MSALLVLVCWVFLHNLLKRFVIRKIKKWPKREYERDALSNLAVAVPESNVLSSSLFPFLGMGRLLHLKHEHVFSSAMRMEISARGEVWVLEGCICLNHHMQIW